MPSDENVLQESQSFKSGCGAWIFLISTSVTQQFQKCHNGTVLFLLWYCNGIPKTIATIEEIRFGTEKTLAKHIPPIL